MVRINLDGVFSVGRMRGNVNTDHPIRIELRGPDRKVIANIYVGLAEFSDAVVGNAGMQPCSIELFSPEKENA